MSVKQELATLKSRREDLKKKWSEICSTLDNLSAQKAPLVQKAEALSTRTSSLAQTLLERTQKELDAVNQEMNLVLEKQANLERELKENEDGISERENSTTLYIQEQANLMISKFLEYMGEHLEDIGSEIQKKYRIIEVTQHQPDRYDSYYTPTGDIGIYDPVTKSFILTSSDFYFQNTLYTLKRGEYDSVICKYTEWYKDYLSHFTSALLETLEKNYNYGEFFNLTINDSSFTLELV